MRLNNATEPITLLVKAVPGASRDQIAGRLGNRLKVKVSAPPEAGKANKAICDLIAAQLGIKKSQVSIASGHANPEKRFEVFGSCNEAVDALFDT
jgi:uncharacterized protein (TIGR00251 family)